LIRQAREQGGIGQMPAEAMLEMKGILFLYLFIDT